MKPTLADFPRTITIEPTNRCNLRCVYCPRHLTNTPVGNMEPSLHQKLLNEMAAHAPLSVVLFHRGESLLYPMFSDLVLLTRTALGEKSKLSLATNGVLLNQQMSVMLARLLNFLSFSIGTAKHVRNLRGADYGLVRQNIEAFLDAANGKVKTQVSMVRTAGTQKEDVKEFIETWRGKVDRIRIYDEHSTGGRFGSLLYCRKGKRRPCAKLFDQTVISWDGAVRRCNHDWNGEPLGSVVGSSIREVWHGEKYRELRQQHFGGRITDETCRGCDSWYTRDDEARTGILIKREESA